MSMIEVRCSKCDGKGRLSVAKLIQVSGPDKRLPDLGQTLMMADCPKATAGACDAATCSFRSLLLRIRRRTLT